jgi:penicillin amidase
MELMSRVVKGRISEVVGEVALESDIFWRKLELERKASLWWNHYAAAEPEMAAEIEAYTCGINDYIVSMGPGEKPLEFHLLGFEPAPWKEENLFYLLRYMSHILTYNEDDLKATEMQFVLGEKCYNFWYPTRIPAELRHPIYPEFVMDDAQYRRMVTVPGLDSEQRVSGSSEVYQYRSPAPHSPISMMRFPRARVKTMEDFGLGSNNWAVSGRKTRNGRPYLCNDTHLMLAFPSTWYEIHKEVVAKDGRAGSWSRGFGVAGSPFVITGFNRHVAWGMTNATWDLTDFYWLERDGRGHYKLDGRWEPLDSFEVAIKVKGREEPVRKKFYRTYFGPADTASGNLLALRWIGEEAGNEGAAFHYLGRAKNIDEAFTALHHFRQPPQNIVLADAGGNIGMMTAGAALIHPDPQRGIRIGNRRAARIPFTEMHNVYRRLNPATGYVSSANQEQVDHPIAEHISTRYESRTRGLRISSLMESHPDGSMGPEQLRALHMDVYDGEWEMLKPLLQQISGSYWTYLKDWDGVLDTVRVEPTLYNSFRRTAMEMIGAHLDSGLRWLPVETYALKILVTRDSLLMAGGWMPKLPFVRVVWDSSLARLSRSLGKDIQGWAYGKYHQTRVQHLLKLDPLSIEPFASPGNNRTLNVAGKLPSNHSASMRTIIGLSPQGPDARLMLTGGQSGRFNSPNYRDQIPHWLYGIYHPATQRKAFRTEDYRHPGSGLRTVRFRAMPSVARPGRSS